MKFVQRHGFRHKRAPPDQGADSEQHGFQLQSRSLFRRCPGIRHVARLREALRNASSVTLEMLAGTDVETTMRRSDNLKRQKSDVDRQARAAKKAMARALSN